MYKLITSLVLMMIVFVGCDGGDQEDYLSDVDWFDTKEEALDHHFSPSHELTVIQTINDEEIVLTSLNDHTFDMSEIVKQDGKYAIADISATYSLNNTAGGGFEFKTLNEHIYYITFSQDQEQNDIPASSSEKFYFYVTTEKEHSDDVIVTLDATESTKKVQK